MNTKLKNIMFLAIVIATASAHADVGYSFNQAKEKNTYGPAASSERQVERASENKNEDRRISRAEIAASVEPTGRSGGVSETRVGSAPTVSSLLNFIQYYCTVPDGGDIFVGPRSQTFWLNLVQNDKGYDLGFSMTMEQDPRSTLLYEMSLPEHFDADPTPVGYVVRINAVTKDHFSENLYVSYDNSRDFVDLHCQKNSSGFCESQDMAGSMKMRTWRSAITIRCNPVYDRQLQVHPSGF